MGTWKKRLWEVMRCGVLTQCALVRPVGLHGRRHVLPPWLTAQTPPHPLGAAPWGHLQAWRHVSIHVCVFVHVFVCVAVCGTHVGFMAFGT